MKFKLHPLFLLGALVWLAQAANNASDKHQVDLRYAPAHYLTAVCLPDDWHKTLVNETGALCYDAGPGPYAATLTQVSFGVREQALKPVRQTLADARVPVITTELSAANVTLRQQSFSLVTPGRLQGATKKLPFHPRVRRLGPYTGAANWAAPKQADALFNNVAWGTNRPILYRVKVAPGSRHRVALGVVEPYKPKPKLRTLELRVEGAPAQSVDPMASGERNQPAVYFFDGQDENNDGELNIEAYADQASPDPNAILNAFWLFAPETQVSATEIIRGQATAKAALAYTCGVELEAAAPAPALDGLIGEFNGAGGAPVITIRSPRTFTFDAATGLVKHNGLPYLLARPRPLSLKQVGNLWTLELPPATKRAELIVIHGKTGRAAIRAVPNLELARQRAQRYWLTEAPIPRQKIRVPDAQLQFLLDASVRNIYQIREVVNGGLEFHPGPTVYRGLWLPDSLFAGSAIQILNDLPSLRRFLEDSMRHQLPNGQVRVLSPLTSPVETPDFIYAICRYAQTANDPAWLRRHWRVVTQGVEWIRATRAQTLNDPTQPYFGIMPPGFVDGGIADLTADFGTTWWALAAIERSIAAAHWLGETQQAAAWQTLFDEFFAAARQAAQRDLRPDKTGNVYLPVRVGVKDDATPLKAQHAFIFPAQYAAFFQRQDDPVMRQIVNGNLGLLGANLKQGIVFGTAWRDDGVWGWLGAAHAITLALFDRPQEAQTMLYAVANHFTPTGVQVEEQQTKDVGTGTSGDHSNAEASAIFIHATRMLLARERGHDLELLNALPVEWLQPKARLELNNTLTEFGPLTLQLHVAANGQTATLRVLTEARQNTGQVIINLKTLQQAGFTFGAGQSLPEQLKHQFGKPLTLALRRR